MAKITPHELEKKLKARFSDGFSKLSDLADPLSLTDAKKAAMRLKRAIKDGERITVVGDYDVDGVVSTAIMREFFTEIKVNVNYVIPNRFRDGYGVSPAIIERLNTDLVITVDNGINAFEAATAAKKKGIDLIITDHHTPAQTLPDAYCVINPKRVDCDFKHQDICGAQVAWFFIASIKKVMSLNIQMQKYLDLLVLAIIADVMPLTDINRTLVQAGLNSISKSNRPAFKAMRSFLNKRSLRAEDIAFQIAPRINSAGRMEDASLALDFLSAKNENDAMDALLRLDGLNQLRKETEARISEEAISIANNLDSIIVVASEDWHEGVIGIVASRLVGHFGKPAFVLSIEDGRAKGSARSIGNIDLYNLLDESSEHLLGFGGHKMAAGLALGVENIEEFSKSVNESAKKYSDSDFISKNETMGELEFEHLTLNLLEMLEQFEPYGEANPKPSFTLEEALIVGIRKMGSNQEHVRYSVQSSGKTMDVIAFRHETSLKRGDFLNCIYTVNKNSYRGETSVQLLMDKIL